MTALTPIDDEQLERTLLHLEHEGWQALCRDDGADFYRAMFSAHALVVFPAVVLDKDRAIEGMADAPPWAEFRIDEPRIVRLTEQSAVLTYTATACRPGEPDYHAIMSSVYVENGGAWKLAFHQQTPLGES